MQKYHTAFRHDCTLRQSMKFANRDSLYDGILCMSMDRVGVFSGIYTGILCFLVLTFKQKNRAPSQRRPYKNTKVFYDSIHSICRFFEKVNTPFSMNFEL